MWYDGIITIISQRRDTCFQALAADNSNHALCPYSIPELAGVCNLCNACRTCLNWSQVKQRLFKRPERESGDDNVEFCRSCDIMWPFSAVHCLVVWSLMILLPTFMRQFEVKHFEQVAVVTNKKYLLNVYIISWSQNTNQFHNISVSDRSVVRLLPSVTLQQGQHALYRLQTREIGAVIVRPVTRDLHHDRHAADPLLPGGRHHHLRHPYRGERVQQAGGWWATRVLQLWHW